MQAVRCGAVSGKLLPETVGRGAAMLTPGYQFVQIETRSGGNMKAFITALAVMLVFAVGPVSASHTDSQGEASGGCNKSKWEDT